MSYHLAADIGVFQRLRREIMVWMKLKHGNVLPLFGTASGFGQFPAMVCPWLENGALTSYLGRFDLGIRQVLALVCMTTVNLLKYLLT